MNEECIQQQIALLAIGRLGKPQVVADLVEFLNSEQAFFVTGKISWSTGDILQVKAKGY